MSTVRRSLGFAFIERYLIIAMQLVSFTMLARLLTPQEIGLYSVSLALISVAQVVRDFGLSNYLIQRKDLEQDDIDSALGLSLLFGVTLCVLINLCAPLVASFYNAPSLTAVVRIISLNFLITPLNSILIALLRRDMRFDVLMRINVCAAVVSTATTLGLAWSGFGTWSLALGEIASNGIICAGLIMAGGLVKLGRPSLLRWRPILAFGGPVTAGNIVTSVSMDINDLVVGRVLGFQQVAISSRAQGLMNLFHRDIMGPIRAVAYPAFARAHRENDALEDVYINSVALISAVAWPFYGFMALFSLEVLRLMFGPQWDASAPLVPLFCLAGAFSAVTSLIPTLILSTGRAHLVAGADLIFQPLRAVALTLAVYYYRALEPLAITYIGVTVLAIPYFYTFKQHCLPTDFPLLLRQVAKSLLLSVLTLLPAALACVLWRPPGGAFSVVPLFACVAVTAISWAGGVWLLRHPLGHEIAVLYRARFPKLVDADRKLTHL